ncbi:MAG: 2-oxoacid:acceptor oxidoreductase subunit alpha [Cyanobacteria bacterium]|nr:2-oxoacid:acceptor oxidoreductase subunit alpha [Cyanobacteriota bacterium]
MSAKNVIVRIAGAAGDGIASTGEILGKTCSRMGLHVLAYNSFQSAIRGGHVWLQMAIGADEQLCHGEQPEVVLLFNKTSPAVHVPDVKPGGLVFYNAGSIKKEDIEAMRSDVHFYGLDFKAMVDEAGLTGVAPIMINTMLSGALVQSLDLDTSIPLEFIKHKFQKKGDEVVDLNQAIFNLGATWTEKHVKEAVFQPKGSGVPKMFMTGNEAFGLGLAAGGLKLYSAYPMSPATGILHYLATIGPKEKIVIKQVEDEIAAMNMVVGAGTAGVRAATATASGGYCLMIEAVGLSSMMETPTVCIVVSRGGPSTGVPTKQEQSDIDLMIAGNGDSPRFVVAPKDPEDAFYQAARALNMAEKYQIPVLVLSDFFLSEHFRTIDDLDFSKVEIERGKFSTEWEGEGRYKRYEYTEDGVSHRVRPGAKNAMYVPCSDEHNEYGHVMSDVEAGLPHAREARIKMHAKRMQKMKTMVSSGDVVPPSFDGDANAEITFMTWGSTFSYAQEAIKLLAAEGVKVNILHFTDLFPMPREAALERLRKCKRIISVEANMCNSLCKHVLAETAFEVTEHINRWDGEPFTGEYIVNEFKKLAVKKTLVNA